MCECQFFYSIMFFFVVSLHIAFRLKLCSLTKLPVFVTFFKELKIGLLKINMQHIIYIKYYIHCMFDYYYSAVCGYFILCTPLRILSHILLQTVVVAKFRSEILTSFKSKFNGWAYLRVLVYAFVCFVFPSLYVICVWNISAEFVIKYVLVRNAKSKQTAFYVFHLLM